MRDRQISKISIVFKWRDFAFKISERKLIIFMTYLTPVVFFGHIYLKRYLEYHFPLGWDTPYYLYIARMLDQQGFVQTFYHPRVRGTYILPSALILIFNKITQDIFLSVKILQFATVILLITVSVNILLSRFGESTGGFTYILAPIISLSFLSWWSPIRLAADLLGNFINYTLIIVSLLLASSLSKKRNTLALFSLGIISGALTGLSHVFTSMFFAFLFMFDLLFLITIQNSLREVLSREGLFHVGFISSSLCYLLFILSLRPGIVGLIGRLINTQTFTIELLTFTKFFGYYFTLLSIVSCILFIVTLFRSLILHSSSLDRGLLSSQALPYRFLLMLSTVAIVSYLFFRALPPSVNWLFGFSGRAVVMVHIPVLLTFLTETLIVGSKSMKKSKMLLTALMVVLLTILSLLSLPYQYNEASIHLRPFLYSDNFIKELTLLKNENLTRENPILVIVYLGDNREFYRDFSELIDNWIGAFIGDHLTYFGTLDDFLLLRNGLTGKFWFIDYYNIKTIEFLNANPSCENGINAFILESTYKHYKPESSDFQLQNGCRIYLKVISADRDTRS